MGLPVSASGAWPHLGGVALHYATARMTAWGRTWKPVKIACVRRQSAIGLPHSQTPKVPATCWPWLRFNGESWRKRRPNDKSPIGHLCRKRYVRTSTGQPNVGRSLLALGPLAVAASGRDLSIAAHVDDSIEIRAMPYHAIFGEFLSLMLGPWMRRAAGQQAFFKVVDSKNHLASMHVGRSFVLRLFPDSPYAKEHSNKAPKTKPTKPAKN